MNSIKKLLIAGMVVLWLPAMAGAQEVFKEISSTRLEDILKGMDIEFTKGTGQKGTTWYNYKSKTFALRLWNFNGKDLMIDAFLAKVDWDAINKWNSSAKFSRARLHKDVTTGIESAVIEWNLDLGGGVTEETIKHFIKSFDLEVAGFSNSSSPVVTEEETFKNVASDRLERILRDLNIDFRKTPDRKTNNIFYYDFERNNFKIRLTNFGGQDLMIDCAYAAAPLAKVNQWNIKRTYVRAVFYPGSNNTKPVTTLESNLDCLGGTTDGIIRYFISSFDGEVKAFDEFLRESKK
jgi:Putative bacterial sensory transduction regulator